MIVLAHAGHWAVSLIYAAPVLVIVGWVAFEALRDRRRGDEDDQDQAT